jgi:hypothetical protein
VEFKDLKLEEISFSDRTPTKSQIVNALRSMQAFLSRSISAMILAEEFTYGDPAVAQALGAVVQVKAAADAFENGPNTAGLATPAPRPGIVGR